MTRTTTSRAMGFGSLFTESVKAEGARVRPASRAESLRGARRARRARLPPRLAGGVALPLGGVDQPTDRPGDGVPDPVLYPGGQLLRDRLGLDVLLEVLDVRGHAAPEFEHLTD